jgi:hypothetical protein
VLLINPTSSGVCTVHPNSAAKPMQRSIYSIISAVVSLAVNPATVTDCSPIQLTRWQKHLLADFVHLRDRVARVFGYGRIDRGEQVGRLPVRAGSFLPVDVEPHATVWRAFP